MTDRFARLYPTSVAEALVAPTFAVPRFPTADRVRNETTVRQFYSDRLLAEFDIAGSEDRIAIVDKLFPHARFDAMVLASNDVVRSSTSDLSPVTLGAIFELCERFVAYVSDPGVVARYGLENGEIHVAYNYDRDTIDRDNAMFYDKRFHLHLNCWPAGDLAKVTPIRYGDVSDPMIRRRLVDPVAALAARIIREAAGGELDGFALSRSAHAGPGDPVGLKVHLGTWSALREPAFHKLLRSLHDVAEGAYRDIRTALVGDPEPYAPWTRPRLLSDGEVADNLHKVTYLSPRSRDDLMLLARQLSDADAASMAAWRADPLLAVRRLSLNGLDYSIGLYTREVISAERALSAASDVGLLMQCRLFGDVGGAGLPPLRGNAAVRLDRKDGPVMSQGEIDARTGFQAGFIDSHVNQMVQGGALRPIRTGERS